MLPVDIRSFKSINQQAALETRVYLGVFGALLVVITLTAIFATVLGAMAEYVIVPVVLTIVLAHDLV